MDKKGGIARWAAKSNREEIMNQGEEIKREQKVEEKLGVNGTPGRPWMKGKWDHEIKGWGEAIGGTAPQKRLRIICILAFQLPS